MSTETLPAPNLKFKDAANREWDLKLTLGINNRLKDAKIIDLLKILADKMRAYRELMSDPAALAAAVWVIVQPQAEEGFTGDDFLLGLDGGAIDAMLDTFTRAIADFSRPLREVILKGMEKGKAVQAAGLKGSLQAMDEADLSQIEANALATTRAAVKNLTSGTLPELSTSVAGDSA